MRKLDPFLVTIMVLAGGGCAQVLGYDDLDFSASGGSSSGSGGVADSGSADVLNDASLGGSAGAAGSAGGAAAGAAGSSDAGSSGDAGDAGSSGVCTGQGPAYVHGDLWAFWHNDRVACDAQHRWVWICQQRLGPGNCSVEAQRFQDCWNAMGQFPPTSWGGDSTPTPHSANDGVCQPHQWPEKNAVSERPGNPIPCDTTTFEYDSLGRQDPFYGMDWGADPTSLRHLSLKVFAFAQDPYSNEGQSDGLVALSTHPFDKAAFMEGIGNHTYEEHVLGGGCIPPFSGEQEDPFPAQSFGAFFWLEVPTDQPVTLSASWIGPVGDDLNVACLPPGSGSESIYGFPSSFSYHSVDGKPWFITTPCYDLVENVQLEPGRHYLWDIDGFRILPDCSGPPKDLLELVPVNQRDSFKDGSCSSI